MVLSPAAAQFSLLPVVAEWVQQENRRFKGSKVRNCGRIGGFAPLSIPDGLSRLKALDTLYVTLTGLPSYGLVFLSQVEI